MQFEIRFWPNHHEVADMTALANRPYVKMNGLGNEIVVVDLRGTSERVSPAEAIAVAGRAQTRFDQMMVLHDPRTEGTAARIRILNQDGSEAGACGNGMRCVGWVLAREGGEHWLTETRAGLLSIDRLGPLSFTVDMGVPRFGWRDVPLSEPFQDTRYIELEVGPAGAPLLSGPSVLSMGNPHCVFFVDRLDVVDLGRVGPMLENHPYFPERANISLARVVDRSTIDLNVWERGAGLTRACGSAACATAVAAVRRRMTDRAVTVNLPGGPLGIVWRADEHVMMTGPVELEHEGRFEPSWFEGLAA
jgi:diaminopimelate epimerase